MEPTTPTKWTREAVAWAVLPALAGAAIPVLWALWWFGVFPWLGSAVFTVFAVVIALYASAGIYKLRRPEEVAEERGRAQSRPGVIATMTDAVLFLGGLAGLGYCVYIALTSVTVTGQVGGWFGAAFVALTCAMLVLDLRAELRVRRASGAQEEETPR